MLYAAPKGIKILVDVSDGSKYITFHKIDGMYSYCETETGGVVHLSASTKLKEYKGDNVDYEGFYEIIDEE